MSTIGLWITDPYGRPMRRAGVKVSGLSGAVRRPSGHPLTCANASVRNCPGCFAVRSTQRTPVDNSFPQVRAGEAHLTKTRPSECPKTVRTPPDLRLYPPVRGVREAEKHEFRCGTGCPELSSLRSGGSSGHPAPATRRKSPHAGQENEEMHEEETTKEALTRMANALDSIAELLADATRARRIEEHETGNYGEYKTVLDGY